MTEIIVAILGSGALSAAVGALVAACINRAKRKHGVAAGTQMLLYINIKALGKQFIAEGEITAEDLEDIIEMHRVYHDELAGNGYLDTLMEQVRKLPIKA